MGAPKPVKRFTPEEYYRLEREADYKSDYYDGEIFDMSGGTSRHSLITINICGAVWHRLRGKPCTAYESNQRLKIANGLRCYTDISVYCEPLIYDQEDPFTETATNPTVVFEVLSKSTHGYDRGLKAERYRQIDSLRAYVLISQEMPHVEMFERMPDNSWSLRDWRGLDAVMKIHPIGIELPLAEVYDRVDFAAA